MCNLFRLDFISRGSYYTGLCAAHVSSGGYSGGSDSRLVSKINRDRGHPVAWPYPFEPISPHFVDDRPCFFGSFYWCPFDKIE